MSTIRLKTHPLVGYQIVKQLGAVGDKAALISLQHHEQYDGRGYPRGLRGGGIDEYARIVSIADNYEALIESRSYRERMYLYHAMRNLVSSGSKKFDPIILRAFLSALSVYPVGSIVKLNLGESVLLSDLFRKNRSGL